MGGFFDYFERNTSVHPHVGHVKYVLMGNLVVHTSCTHGSSLTYTSLYSKRSLLGYSWVMIEPRLLCLNTHLHLIFIWEMSICLKVLRNYVWWQWQNLLLSLFWCIVFCPPKLNGITDLSQIQWRTGRNLSLHQNYTFPPISLPLVLVTPTLSHVLKQHRRWAVKALQEDSAQCKHDGFAYL